MFQFFIHQILAIGVSAEMEGFIIGGHFTDIHTWPFIAMLTVEEIEADGKESQGVSTCGGTLISSRTVLTAAHCTDDVSDKHKDFNDFIFSIFMGHSRYTQAPMVRRVKDYISHKNYDPISTTIQYDVSIMFLAEPVRFSRTVRKVILVPHGSSVTGGMKVKVAGWGMTDLKNNQGTTKLKEATQELISTYQCRNILNYRLPPGVVCTVSRNDYAFRGDSGGPLIRQRDHYQLGIVSYRAPQSAITVYTSVAYFHKWIRNTQRILFDKYCS